MKNIFLLIVVLIAEIGYSQDYIQYNRLICEAENKIVESNYQIGLENYLKAFKIVEIPFAKDYYNATLCAAMLGEDSISLIFVEKLMKKGISIKNIKSKSLKTLYKTKRWKELKKKNNEYLEQAKKHQNIELRKELEKLLQNDQDIRKQKYAYPMSDTIAYIDSLNMIEMKSILVEYDYPDENLIGIKHPHSSYSPQYVVIRHYYQSKHYDLTEILYKSVIEGKLSPRVFAELEDKKSQWLGKGDKYGTVGIYVIKGHIDKKDYPTKVVDKYNTNRKKIGLESWADYLKKIEFQESQKEFDFGIVEGKVHIGGISWKQWIEMRNEN